MSLTDPDARNRKAGSVLRPFAWILAILGLASGPILFMISESLGHASSRTGGGYSVGDTFQIRYNPNKPGSARSIVVTDG
jgi:hypothetical protein